MTIKCSPKWLTEILVMSLICIMCIVAGMFKFGFDKIGIGFLCVTSAFMCLNSLQLWVSLGRTFVFDKNGITVKFCKFSKFFKWEELKTKRIEDYSTDIRLKHMKHPYVKAAVFSAKVIRNPFKFYPCYYTIFAVLFTDPFKYIFVYFDPHLGNKAPYNMPHMYEVDEAEFKKCMIEWNVDIENL